MDRKRIAQLFLERWQFLTEPRVIWTNFFATLALTGVFGFTMYAWSFEIIDEMWTPSVILAHIAALDETQKLVHIWLTATVDVMYPLVYGALFIGVALRAFGERGKWLATPSFLVIPVDLFEGFTQIMLLNGYEDYVGAKAIATPVKLALFFAGSGIALAGLIKLYRDQFGRARHARLDDETIEHL